MSAAPETRPGKTRRPYIRRLEQGRLDSGWKMRLLGRLPMALWPLIARTGLIGHNPFLPEDYGTGSIFVHVPKTAGTAIKSELIPGRLGGHREIYRYYAHMPRKAASYFKFCFVRNPWDRLLSAHSYLMQGRGTSEFDEVFATHWIRPFGAFPEFVQRLETDAAYRSVVRRYVHFRDQADYVCLPGRAEPAMDLVGRFERLDEDMGRIRARFGLPDRPLEQVRSSRRGDYRDAYSDRMRRTVEEIYARDIAIFGYGF